MIGMDIDINTKNVSMDINKENVVLENKENKMDIYIDNNYVDVSVDEQQVADIETGVITIGGGTGTTDHNQLINRDKENQHPIKSITGLEEALKNAGSIKDVQVNGSSVVDESGNANITGLVKEDTYNEKIADIEQFGESLDSRLGDLEQAGGEIMKQLGNKADKNDIYTKEEVEQLASDIDERMSNLEEVGGQLIEQLGGKADKSEIPSLDGYATEKWVEDQEYMPVPDFHKYMEFTYYDKTQTDKKFEDYYNKEEVDAKLEDLPTGGTELTGGDNIVIEDNAINVYTNTGYKVSDKDIQIQSIKDSGTTGTTQMVYIDDKEIIILYDGTIKIRRSENGIDFETINLPYSCVHLVYNADSKRLYGTNSRSYFIYSDDYGLTWKTISNSRASGITMMAIGYGQGFRSLNRSAKEVVGWTFNENAGALSQNTRITSTIVPEFTAMVNDTQFVWCNSTGTFKYGAGSNEGNFASLSGITVNLLKRVNNITMLGLKNDNKMYLLEPATSITKYAWIEHSLPDTCTLNDIIFNPYDKTYYIFTDVNTYYKTKDFITFESVDKNNSRGEQGYFTSMGIQMTTSYHNMLLLAPTRTKIENKLQEHDRDLNKSLWVGKGLELTKEGKVNVKSNSDALGVSDYGLYLGQINEYNLPENMIEGIYVAKAEEKGLFDPYEVENWFYSEEAYPDDNGYNAVKFIFTQDGSFYDQVAWETEFIVEKYEYGYLFYDASFTVFKYVKLGNLSWLLDSIIQ